MKEHEHHACIDCAQRLASDIKTALGARSVQINGEAWGRIRDLALREIGEHSRVRIAHARKRKS